MKSPAIHRTPLYRAKAAFSNMRIRCQNTDGKNPAYKDVLLKMTEDEFIAWAVPRYEEFSIRYPEQRPCVARIGDSGNYEINNIEIVSIAENRQKQKAPFMVKPDGTKKCSKCLQTKVAGKDFGIHRCRADGYNYWCKQCLRERSLEAQATHF